jgi:AcrR family transcriptional regulator
VAAERRRDRRVQKTERLLRDALVELIHEKHYDAIVVKEILERANVGRTAFYAHFEDKDALLASGIHHVLRGTAPRPLPPAARRFAEAVWFSLPVFEYVGRCRHAGGAPMGGPRGRAIVHAHLRDVLVERLQDDVRSMMQRQAASAIRIPPDLVVDYVVGTFILVLDWWAGTKSPLSPREVDDIFLSMVLPTLSSAVGHT